MATLYPDAAHDEHCPACERETPHSVTIELRTESEDADDERAAYSREPYRVATCRVCDASEATRMNNA